jgi:phosphohistidine phosphatase
MKRIIIIRHAKSSWANLGQTDFERPLNARGIADAPMMGDRLAARQLKIDALVSSTAVRALQTAQAIATSLQIPTSNIVLDASLYHAPSYVIDEVGMMLPEQCATVAIVCHNNGISHWVNEQCGFVIDNMPTCGIACFESRCNTWSDFHQSAKKLVFLDYPKLGSS